jgi:ceramide glucosyltransferase
VQRKPTHFANPKIAWQTQLSPLAAGKLWLWSDADIVAPPDYLRSICAELEASAAKALTSPYVIRNIQRVEGVLDTLFVNVEFYPGVLLLSRRGTTFFAFGAGTLFYAEEFRQKVDWQKLGSAFADDYVLGKLLGTVAVGQATVETLPEQESWGGSLRHFMRWHKTIRWCQPLGYAGQIVILPVLGWLIFVICHPQNPMSWRGLLVSTQIETCIAMMICRRIGCRLPLRWLWAVEGWTVLRPMVWLASWLPLPVEWSGVLKK